MDKDRQPRISELSELPRHRTLTPPGSHRGLQRTTSSFNRESMFTYPLRFSFKEIVDTFIYCFTADVTQDEEERDVKVNYDLKIDEKVIKQMRDYASEIRTKPNVLDNSKIPPEVFICGIDRYANIPHFVKIYVTSNVTPMNPLIPAKLYRNSFGVGDDYFRREPNIFIQTFGRIENTHIRNLEYLSAAEQRVVDGTFRSFRQPSWNFISRFFNDVRVCGYLDHLIRPKEQTKRLRFERIRSSSKDSHKSSGRTTSLFDDTSQQRDYINYCFESFLAEKFKARLAYMDGVMFYLTEQVQTIDIFWRPVVVNLLIVSIILLTFAFALTVAYYNSNDFYAVSCVFYTLVFDIILIVFAVKIFFHYQKRTRNSLILKFRLFHGKLSSFFAFISSSLEGKRNIRSLTVILLLPVAVLVTWDVIYIKTPIPVIADVVMIYVLSLFSIHKAGIEWTSVLCCFSAQFLIASIFFQSPQVNAMTDKIGFSVQDAIVDILSEYSHSKNTSSFPPLFLWVCLTLLSSSMIEIASYFDFFRLLFCIFGWLSRVIHVTKVEFSYLIAGSLMTYQQLARINTNMLRILTESELCLVFTVLFASCSFVSGITFLMFGLPFGFYLRFLIASAPGHLGMVKLLCPSKQISLTSRRGVYTRHPSVVSFTKLITDFWISSCAVAFKTIALTAFSTIAIVAVNDLFFYIVYEVTGLKLLGFSFSTIMGYLLSPLIIAGGIFSSVEAKVVGELFANRFIFNNFYGTFKLSTHLSRRWFSDCLVALNTSSLGGMPVFEDFDEKFLEAIAMLSDRSLFMSIPLIISEGSFSFFIMLCTSFACLMPAKRLHTTIRIATRAFITALFSNFHMFIIAGLIYTEKNHLTCPALHMYDWKLDGSFCKSYIKLLNCKPTKSLGNPAIMDCEEACFAMSMT